MATSATNSNKNDQQPPQKTVAKKSVSVPIPPTITTTVVASGDIDTKVDTSLNPVPPPPSLQLLEPRLTVGGGGGGGGSGYGGYADSDDDDDDDDEMRRHCNEDLVLSDQGAGSRRPSTSSLSRFRSCPQLASVMNVSQDSPGCDMAPMTDADGNILHTSPVIHHHNNNNNNNSNTLQVERPRYEMTSTPTPPSTPGSRRKEVMVTSPHSPKAVHTNINSNGASPCATPSGPPPRHAAGDQGTTNANAIPRTVSSESQVTEGAISGRVLTSENLLRLDELSLKDSLSKRRSFYDDTSLDDDRTSDRDDASSMHLCGRYSQQTFQLQHSSDQHSNVGSSSQQRHQHSSSSLLYPGGGDDSVDKCNRWLQGLKLTKSDKIKSRSHIQLPAL